MHLEPIKASERRTLIDRLAVLVRGCGAGNGAGGIITEIEALRTEDDRIRWTAQDTKAVQSWKFWLQAELEALEGTPGGEGLEHLLEFVRDEHAFPDALERAVLFYEDEVSVANVTANIAFARTQAVDVGLIRVSVLC
jgi:hypothetical protein